MLCTLSFKSCIFFLCWCFYSAPSFLSPAAQRLHWAYWKLTWQGLEYIAIYLASISHTAVYRRKSTIAQNSRNWKVLRAPQAYVFMQGMLAINI